MGVRQLFGREPELHLLDALVRDVAAGRGRAQLLVGPAGIGKTALLQAVGTEAAPTAMRVFQLEGALDGRGRANGLLEVLIGTGEDRLAKLDPDDREALLRSIGRAAGPVAPAQVNRALLQFLTVIDEPTLVIVDDLHLVDESSLQSLVAVAHRVTLDSVGMVFGARPDRSWNDLGLPVMLLEGLEPNAAIALAVSVGDGHVASGGSAEALRLHRLVEGNPLGLLTLLERGVSSRPRVDVDPRAGSNELGALIGCEPSGRRAVVGVAARRLGIQVIDDVADAVPGLVVDSTTLAWTNSSARDGALARVEPSRLREFHEALAGVDLIDIQQRAYHLIRARSAPDADTCDLLTTIGRQSLAQAGPAAAAATFLDAARFAADGAVRAELLCEAGIAALQTNQLDLARHTLEEALMLPGTEATELRAVLGLGATLAWGTGPIVAADRMRAHARRAESEGRPTGVYLAAAASFEVMAARIDRADADAVAAALDAPDAVGSLLAGAIVVQTAGLSGRAAEVVQRAAELSEVVESLVAADLAGSELPAHQLVAFALGHDLLDDAERLLARLVESSRRRGLIGSFALTFRADAMWRTGRWNEALAIMEHALALEDPGLALAAVQSTAARLRAFRGDAEAERLAVAALEVSGPMGAALFEAWACWALAVHARTIGDLQWAEENHERIRAIRRAGGAVQPGALWAEPDRIDVLMAMGHRDEATEAAQALLLDSQRCSSRWGIAAGHRALSAVIGDEHQARRHHRQAVATFRELRYPFELARAQLIWAERHPGDGVDSASAARSVFARLGAHPWMVRSDAVLASSTGLQPDRNPSTTLADVLSPAELRVAMQAAEGGTTEAIASQLFLSRKTVESHLGSIYRKLGVANRGQLVRRVLGGNSR